ncbi:glypican-6-like [Lingula anatina]|uniref:Glypican-6-like n=1 Tax=Lingula anatina TaxID=7574 RepID=A0A1S3JTS2_LINAN|nr:glypican-6-like [Lingula anatina]|eukprot:XP_013413496.1 glypican-6-like [Lingula anatina]
MNDKMAELVTKFTRTLWPCFAALLLYLITDTSALYCQPVKNVYSSRGANFDRKDIPLAPLSGEHLQVCHHGDSGLTCCTREVETKLYNHSRDDYDSLLADSTTSIRHIFITKTAKFDEFFTELLENGRKDFHSMFVRTYGQLYQQNAHIFNDLFTDLRSYYRGRNINLLDALENFFATLFQRMFQLLNAQYELDQSYLGCVANTMDKLNPFGDVPQKFSQQLKRSFVAARTFMQGLAIGRDVILQVGKIQPYHNCRKSLMKMMYCSYCSGLPTIKPCNNYCLNVMKGCLAYQAELNSEWNKYISKLSHRRDEYLIGNIILFLPEILFRIM